MEHRNSSKGIGRCLPLILALMLAVAGLGLTGCGGGGDGTSAPGDDEAQVEREQMENALEYTLQSVDQAVEDAQDFATVNDANQYFDLGGGLERPLKAASDVDISLDFPCGSVEIETGSIVYTFISGGVCGDLGGTVTVSYSRPADLSTYVIEYDDFTTGACTADGIVSINGVDRYGNLTTTSYTYQDYEVCCTGVTCHTMNGTAALVYDSETNLLTVELPDRSYSYEGGLVSAEADVRYDGESGMEGSVSVVIDGKTYQASLDGVQTDAVCGVPIGGSVTLAGPDGNTLTADFSETSCENPYVTYTLNGTSYTFRLRYIA